MPVPLDENWAVPKVLKTVVPFWSSNVGGKRVVPP